MKGMDFTINAKLGSRGQVTLPKVVREQLHLKAGSDYVKFKLEDDNSVKLEKLVSNKESIKEFWKREDFLRQKYNLTKEDPESEVDWGPDVGAEVINWGDDFEP